MKVLFLISDAFGIGGTIRTTFNLAEELARRGHDVEVLSTFRRRDTPRLPLDPAVRLLSLLEVRPEHPDFDAADPLRGRPAVVYPRDDYRAGDYDRLAEDRAARYLRDSDADVVIGTRPGLIAWIARLAPERMIRIGQEHLTRTMHRRALRAAMGEHYRRLDAFVTVSARDAEDYRKHLKLPHTRLLFIPNSVPAPRVPVSDGRHRIVVAAGRLVANKRYDLLIRAFATVVKTHPDWQLRLYGDGEKRAELRRLVIELGLHNHVLLMGGQTPIEPEWAKGAIAAVPSDVEPFGMTLVEAMRCGLPVVSTDAPYGPAEIITDGVDGHLTPVGDSPAMAAALLELIDHPQRRAEMATAALRDSARYDPAPVAERYEHLFAELAADKARRRVRLTDRIGRLRAAFGAGRRPAPILGPAALGTDPVADCTVAASGDLVLRLPAAVVPSDATLEWHRVGGGSAESAAVPELVRSGDTMTATVGLHDVPPGSWELQLVAGPSAGPDRPAGPVAAGFRDTRALLDGRESPNGGVHVRVPYRSPAGSLQVRVWRRPVHPEIGEVSVDGTQIRFEGRLLGAPFRTGRPLLELRCRTADGPIERIAVHPADDSTFHVTLPAGVPAAHRTAAEDLWDLWLHYDDDAEPVRLGRFLDDVVDKRSAYTYPDAVLYGLERGDTRVQPYYTMHNEFSVRVANLPS